MHHDRNDDRSVLLLDRAERAALRRDIECVASGFADFHSYVMSGDRVSAHRLRDHLDAMFAVLDAIGWAEQPDSPDEQPVRSDLAPATWWIKQEADGLVHCLEESDPAGAEDMDADLLAISVLRRLAAAQKADA